MPPIVRFIYPTPRNGIKNENLKYRFCRPTFSKRMFSGWFFFTSLKGIVKTYGKRLRNYYVPHALNELPPDLYTLRSMKTVKKRMREHCNYMNLWPCEVYICVKLVVDICVHFYFSRYFRCISNYWIVSMNERLICHPRNFSFCELSPLFFITCFFWFILFSVVLCCCSVYKEDDVWVVSLAAVRISPATLPAD